jgi:phenylpyruvate tautomerase PptA (4-oxalocrotonate tautomerase family)
MPTYVCSVPNGKLNDAQKQQIAVAISKRHSKATGAPPFFVNLSQCSMEATTRNAVLTT